MSSIIAYNLAAALLALAVTGLVLFGIFKLVELKFPKYVDGARSRVTLVFAYIAAADVIVAVLWGFNS